jgi:GAF domain-containing protein
MAKLNEINDRTLSTQLKDLLKAINTGGKAILLHSNDALLKSIVEVAARIFNAAASSILLVDEQEQLLEFKVAYGAANHDLAGMKFPMDKGIAGYVVMTGQPLSVSNVRQDPRFNQDFAKSTGYVPNSILASPLLAGDRVIGVMEVLDKINEPSFGIQDMELLALFSNQAALAINQSCQMDSINQAVVSGLRRLVLEEKSIPSGELLHLLDNASNFKANENLLKIADLFNELGSMGEAEQKACLQILTIFAEYKRNSHRKWS